MSRNVIQFWIYAVPLPLFAATYFLWTRWSTSPAFVCHVMFLPVVYSYVGLGIATNLLKKWRFKGPWVVGNCYVHHDFVYAANMSPPPPAGFCWKTGAP